MFPTVISSHEDTTLLNNKWNELVLYLKLSSFFVDPEISYTYSVYFFQFKEKVKLKNGSTLEELIYYLNNSNIMMYCNLGSLMQILMYVP